MKQILILGAGGFGRELWNHLNMHPDCGVRWKVKGFIDDNPSALDNFDYPHRVLYSVDNYTPAADEEVLCAIGSPELKQKMVARLKERGARFFTFIHHTALVSGNVEIGEGVVICHNSSIMCDVKIGDFATINGYCGCGHDSRIGRFATLSGYCIVPGAVKIGEGAFIASGAAIAPGKTIGDGAFVGIGSVVIQNVRNNARVFGNPAAPFN